MSAILLGYQCLKRINASQTSSSSENNVVSIVNTRRRSLRYHKNDVCLKRKGTRLDNPYVVGPWHLLRRNSYPVLPQGTSGIKRVRTRNESAVVDTPAKPKNHWMWVMMLMLKQFLDVIGEKGVLFSIVKKCDSCYIPAWFAKTAFIEVISVNAVPNRVSSKRGRTGI